MEEMGLRVKRWGCRWSQGDAAELQLGMFEIENEADLKACCTKIIQHPTDFVIRDALYRLGINNDFSENNEIGNILTHFRVSIVNRETCLLRVWDVVMAKIDDQRLFIRLFVKAMSQRIQDGKGATDDPLGLAYINPISSICVHPVNLWFYFFRPATDHPAGADGLLANRWRWRRYRIPRCGWRGS